MSHEMYYYFKKKKDKKKKPFNYLLILKRDILGTFSTKYAQFYKVPENKLATAASVNERITQRAPLGFWPQLRRAQRPPAPELLRFP